MEDAPRVDVATLVVDDVAPFSSGDGSITNTILVENVRRNRVITLENPRGGVREVRMRVAEAVFNLPDYRAMVEACEAAHLALRSGPTIDKDYSYELRLLNDALGNR